VAKAEKNNKVNTNIKNKVSFGGEINLIPPASETDIVYEGKKSTFNLGGAIAILLFAVLSIAIFGFNVITKLQLNTSKTEVAQAQEDIGTYSDLITMNEEMNKRVQVFDQVQESTISYKSVFDYWDSVSNATSEIDSIKLNASLNFTVEGSASSLSDVSKMWHLLSTDSRVLDVNLKSVGKASNGVNYEFTGKLDYKYFKSLNLTQ
jgi:hypothetical protein